MNLQQAKQRLNEIKAELESRLASTHKHIHGKEAPVSANFHEQVVETSNEEVVQLLESEGQAELQQVCGALARIDNGTYLQCKKCGNEIGEQRLSALPFTDRCIKCA